MLFEPIQLILLLLLLGFWIMILWALVTTTKTVRRIATSFEQLARQTEERGAH
jgi:hypothetical protein